MERSADEPARRGAVDLDEDDVRVYRELLRRPAADVADLAQRTSMDLARVDAAVRRLRCWELASGDGALRAGSPHARLTGALLTAQQELARDERALRLSADRAALLHAEFVAAQDRVSVVAHTTLEDVRARLGDAAREARRECLSFTVGRASADAMEASRPLNEAALARGVVLRCVYQESVRNDRAALAYAGWLTGAGGAIRTVPVVPLQVVLVDREVAFVPLDPEVPRAGALEIRTPGIVAAVGALFDQVWDVADPMPGGHAPAPAPGATHAERDLLRLLAQGHTDEFAARRLDLSTRTVRRMMADLAQRLGARSRFEAGVLAERHGWLGDGPGAVGADDPIGR